MVSGCNTLASLLYALFRHRDFGWLPTRRAGRRGGKLDYLFYRADYVAHSSLFSLSNSSLVFPTIC